ncbi:MAG: YraN family protein [Gammaproteobacteria bacterium]|jgi:putative endonuclease
MNTEYYPHRFGKYAEEQVCQYLQRQGLQLIVCNYACRYGEIDLIMQDKDCIVFVEVRARAEQDFRDSLESVDYHKQRKVIRAATYYLQKLGKLNRVFCRFDVVAVKLKNEQLQFHWVKNAFC